MSSKPAFCIMVPIRESRKHRRPSSGAATGIGCGFDQNARRRMAGAGERREWLLIPAGGCEIICLLLDFIFTINFIIFIKIFLDREYQYIYIQ